MDRISKLYQRAQELATDGLQVDVCILFPAENDKVKAHISLWDGVTVGGGKDIDREFDTEQEALEYIEKLAAAHPPKKGHKRTEPHIITLCERRPKVDTK